MAGTCARAHSAVAKAVLEKLTDWTGMLRYSVHTDGDLGTVRTAHLQEMRLEGIVCKKADGPYQAGRGHGWLQAEMPGAGRVHCSWLGRRRRQRTSIGALHLGYFDPKGGLHYAGAAAFQLRHASLTRFRPVSMH